ncbi:Coiled-coil domain-containing protein 87 [Nowakowskiella sp. JEL0407]|nr:Coiled-coil domain-containing protein 87 [Nowakowskiella sp. JEL0407]
MESDSDSDLSITEPSNPNQVFAKLASQTSELIPDQEDCRINTFDHATYFPNREFKVFEDTTGGCGGKTWEAAHVLSNHLMHRYTLNNLYFYNKSICELGSGTGIVGLLAVLLCGPPEVCVNSINSTNADTTVTNDSVNGVDSDEGLKPGHVDITDLECMIDIIHKNVEINLREEEVERSSPEVNRKRYLKTSERRKHTLEFDYSAFEQDLVQTPPTVENKINDIDLSVLERTLPENHLVRTMNSRVSTRVPKGLITLAAEPAAAITEFGSEVDAKLLNGLDEKLIRFKEVEELYDEIMKTVTGNHFETKSDDSNSISCPAAPYDPRLPISNIFLGLSPKITISTIEQYHYQISGFKVPPTSIFATAVAKATSILNPNTKHTQFTPFTSTAKKPKGIKQNEKYTTRQKILQKYKTHPYSPRIKKFPTRQYVPADDFKTNRFKTMQKIVSSRFNTFKYNYGGYIPYDIDTIRVQKLEGFSVKDYLDFVRGRVTDFVSQLLIDERLDAEVARLKLERDEMEKVEEEGREREEKWRRSCEERRRKMLEFRDGFWNAGVIDYIEEINNDKNDMVESDGDGKVVGIESDAAGKFEGNVESSVPESPDAKPDLTTQPTNKLHPITPKTDLDIKKLQSELESIWIQLKMPTDQKLEMAIKYGSPRFSSKLEKAIELWKTITKNIIEREELLLKIENFESTASDPIRFFRPGTEGSSETRLKEAHQREEFMRKLQYYEARITESVSLIKYELNETVTFDGAPYLEKMKRDYTDIIFKLQKSRPHSK